MIQPENFLDLWDVFRNELIGSTWLFIFLSLIAIFYISTRYFRLPFSSTATLGVLFLVVVGASATTGLMALWVFMLFIVGSFWAVMFSRWFFRR